jgi:hypothetical protein
MGTATTKFRLFTRDTWDEYGALLIDLMGDRATDAHGLGSQEAADICKRTEAWHREHSTELKRGGWFTMPDDPDDEIWQETIAEFEWFGSEGMWDDDFRGRMRAFDRIAEQLTLARDQLLRDQQRRADAR